MRRLRRSDLYLGKNEPMKTCLLGLHGSLVIGLPIVTTSDGWERISGPAFSVCDLTTTKDADLGEAVLKLLTFHKTSAAIEATSQNELDSSLRSMGFPSSQSFFRQSLQLMVTQHENDWIEIQPMERKAGGAIFRGDAVNSPIDVSQIGAAVRLGFRNSR